MNPECGNIFGMPKMSHNAGGAIDVQWKSEQLSAYPRDDIN